MAAPKGNQFWRARSTHGRNPIFSSPEQLWEACSEYFDWVEANPLHEAQAFAYQGAVKVSDLPKLRAMTIGAMCIFLDIDRTTWVAYAKSKDFSPVTTRVEEIIYAQKFQGASAGLFNANIIARDLGLADKTEVSGSDGGPVKTESSSDRDLAKAIAALLAKGMKLDGN